MSKRDYYEILGLEKSASEDDIKKAYRKAAMKFHPDRNQGEGQKAAEESFKEAKEAYEFLSDPQKKTSYDRYGHSTTTAGNSHTYTYGASDVDLNEVFSQMFGHGAGNPFEDIFMSGRHNKPNFQQRQTLHIINITLADAYTGRSVKIDQNTTIQIPKGARSGAKFYHGDRIFRVDIAQHAKFKRSNDDLLVDIVISAIEAILGVDAVLEHLDSAKLQFSIPSGIQPGQIVKLTGKGLQNPETDKIGDMLVRVSITVPRVITDAERLALKTINHRDSIII